MTEDAKPREAYLDFEIDKTQESFYEAGSVLGRSFLVYLSLISTSALLVYGNGFNNEVKVPFVELTVNKIYAAIIALVLGSAALYWFFLTLVLNRLLAAKLGALIHERYGVRKTARWNFAYPSAYHAFFAVNRHSASIPAKILMNGFNLLLSFSWVIPVILAWSISVSLGLSPIHRLFVCAVVMLLQTPSMYTFYSSARSLSKLLRCLDDASKGGTLL
jgi:hypothetical protein